MSSFLPNIPQPSDNLDFSQSQILSNNQALDTVFGIDHYKFSDATANKGFHNKVTTPVFIDSPPTGLPPVTTTAPVLYSFQTTAPLGVLQYSRGPNNSVPTPLTILQSPSTGITVTAGATTNVLDFTGLTLCICNLYAFNLIMPTVVSSVTATIYWNGTTLQGTTTSGNLQVVQSGNILQIKNALGISITNLFWSLELIRVQ